MAQIFHEADDMHKAQEVVDKFVDFVRAGGDKLQYADALWIQLPESPLYPILEGRFPHPSKTYESVALILEDFEKMRINSLIGERRTRLGAKLSEVTIEVKREVYGQSRLEHIYRQLINWTNDDELRRSYEEKMLQFCHTRLLVTPPGALKDQEREKVMSLATGMVVINHPFKIAWDISIDWQDHKDINDWDINVLRSYCTHFPESDLYKVVTAFLTSTESPFPPPNTQDAQPSGEDMADDSEDDEEGGVRTSVIPFTEEDRLLMMTDGITTADSTFAYRLVGKYFLHVGEYETTVEFMRKAQEHKSKESLKTGLGFRNTEDAYNVYLGTALVYYQSPRHHQEAKTLFEMVLGHDSTSTSALIGVGLIFEEEEEYDQAIDFLERALKRDGSNLRVRSEAAWVKALKGDLAAAKPELQDCVAELERSDFVNKELLADTQYRVGYCIWHLETGQKERKRRKDESAYAYWLNALNNNRNHAPSYTSLGIYYNDYAKDRKRARRCFQKALELSPAEVVAAERLARSFADDGDWDRVELVARRVVDSGKVKPPPGSKRKGISWPFAAVGVADLNKQEFHKSIVSFQAALRLAPDDYHSWVGLGESYHSSGRYIAATKAILNAQRLEQDSKTDISADTWFTKYMLANIKRELGEYDESIALYNAVIETHADEEGVVLALLQTMVDSALTSVEKGLFGKATELAADTVIFAAGAGDGVLQTFNLWKSVADACSILSTVQSRTADIPLDCVKALLQKCTPEAFEILASVDKVGTDVVYAQGIYANDEQPGVDITRCIHSTILFHKQAIHASANDQHAQAVAYYNLGWAEHRAHACLPSSLKDKASTAYIKTAVRAFKRAIELEAGNSEFWNALGVATSEINPSVSQHAFVRSLYLNERSPVAWTNLGILGLLCGDAKLATEVFTRAQSTDPEYAHAWLGQGFIALLHGNTKEARGLFTHAMEISESSSLPARRHFAASVFDHILTAPPNLSVSSLIQPLFALNQVQNLRPQDFAFGHLSTMFQERIGDRASAVQTLEKICSSIEADYDLTESPDSLARFTLARADLSRAYLAAGSYEKAAECGEMALQLSSDESDSELTTEQRNQARLSAHLTVGLAKYYGNAFDEAVTCFEAALAESNNSPDATCLLAQVLWAEGSETSREKARAALFEVIEKQPGHVQSVLILGVIALLDDDQDSLDAVVEELHSLRTNDTMTTTEQSHISQVLRGITTLGPDMTPQDALAQVQSDVMLCPHLPHGWSALADATGDGHAARTALAVAQRGIPPRGILEAGDLARAFAGTGRAADAQRAVFLAPWDGSGRAALEVTTASL